MDLSHAICLAANMTTSALPAPESVIYLSCFQHLLYIIWADPADDSMILWNLTGIEEYWKSIYHQGPQ